jgi:hypothetical protein
MLGLDQLVADQLYEAIVLDETSAAQLEALPGSPAFRVTTIFSSPDQLALGAAIVRYLADRYTFHLSRTVAITPVSPLPGEDADRRGQAAAAGR